MNKDKFITILLILFMLHDMPMLGYRYSSMVYALLIITLFAFLLLGRSGKKSFREIFPVFLIPILDIIINMGGGLISVFQQISGLLQKMILPLAVLYLYSTHNLKMAKIILCSYLVINFITCLTTYYGCLLFPGASRDLTVGDAIYNPYYYMYQGLNIGGFSFVYSMVLLSVLCIYTIKNFYQLIKGKLLLLLSSIYLIAIGLVVVGTEFTMALLMFILLLIS